MFHRIFTLVVPEPHLLVPVIGDSVKICLELTFSVVLIQVLLTSFEMVMRDQNKLAKETWLYIVVDEAHRYLKVLHWLF